jgi:F-type H+-transporting ATPase subunit b
MSIDLWGLGLQAVNVLVLIWLLSRVFWRPVAAAIAARQAAAQDLLTKAETAKTEAEAERDKLTKAREAIATERTEALAKSAASAEAAAKALREAASAKAEALLAAAEQTRSQTEAKARAQTAEDAAQLAAEIASKLLTRLNPAQVQHLFQTLLAESLSALPEADKTALSNAKTLTLTSAKDLAPAQRTALTKLTTKALDHPVTLQFETDSDLIAGFQLRAAHVVLHNSWRADLDAILKDLTDAA